MQTLFDAASQIAQEIERTRLHLANLEQALAGLKPLITLDANAMALPYEATKADPVIEDIAIVQDAVKAQPAPGKAPKKAKPVAKSVAVKAVKPATPRSVKPASAKAVKAKRVLVAKSKAAKATTSAKPVAAPNLKANANNTKPLVSRAANQGAGPAVPPTGKAIWLTALGKKKLSVEALVDAAMSRLALGSAARPVISNRVTAWLYPAIRAGVVRQVGQKDGRAIYQRVDA